MKNSLILWLFISFIPCKAKELQKPNVLFILVDDMGYSDIGCYGSEIDTPNIDSLAKNGLRFTQMYNTGKCMPSRACLLTGIYAQQSKMDEQPLAMLNSVTIGEVLRPAGYRTLASGKHHGTENLFNRGFDHYYGLRDGCSNLWNPGKKRENEPAPASKSINRYWCDDAKTYHPYTPPNYDFYATDAFTDKSLQWLDEKQLEDKPFFLYLSYTAPHYPLHARPKDIAKYKGKYSEGYRAIQTERYQRMVENGIIDPAKTTFTPLHSSIWDNLSPEEQSKEQRRMEIYAAMIDSVDQNIGRVLAKLKEQGKLENTLIMFASDNGACPETPYVKEKSTNIDDFGSIDSYEFVGKKWATVQNTPLSKWKGYSHEGGIRSPFIISFPGEVETPAAFCHKPVHFIDIMSTLVELTGANYPEIFEGKIITPMQGESLLPSLDNISAKREKPLFWKWQKGGAIRDGDWKAVFYNKKWELFNFSNDHNEAKDLSLLHPEKLATMKKQHTDWQQETRTNQ